MVVSSLWEFPDPLLQEIIITNFRKSFLFYFWFWFLFGVWTLGLGGKEKKGRRKEGGKKKDQKARKGLPHQ
tara:strand:- start:80 stop:292 length:213 start_codon:yes stop_codon:yes gene_type:complete